jgi:predicted component of type VI protein secretion system
MDKEYMADGLQERIDQLVYKLWKERQIKIKFEKDKNKLWRNKNHNHKK